MFDGKHSRRKLRRRIIRQNRYPALDDGRAAVEFLGNEMDRAPMPFVARIDGPLVRVQTGKARQQGRVDVEDAPAEMIHEKRRQDAHKSRQYNQIRLVPVQHPDQRGV